MTEGASTGTPPVRVMKLLLTPLCRGKLYRAYGGSTEHTVKLKDKLARLQFDWLG